MSLIDVRCSDGHVSEVYRHNSDWPKTPPCPTCEKPTEQIHLPQSQRARSVDPVVVYQAPDGTFRFPPDISTSSTAMYDKLGYTRIECRGAAEVRKFEKQWSKKEMSQVRRRIERQQEQYERGESERRSEIRRGLEQGFQIPIQDDKGNWTGRMQTVRLSEQGRDIMRASMDLNDRKGGPKVKEAGCFVEAYSVDRSNRAEDPRRRGQ